MLTASRVRQALPAAWFGRRGRTASRGLKAGLIALVAVLTACNAIDAYGFLAKAHIGHALAGDLAVSGRAADIDAKICGRGGASEWGCSGAFDRLAAGVGDPDGLALCCC